MDLVHEILILEHMEGKEQKNIQTPTPPSRLDMARNPFQHSRDYSHGPLVGGILASNWE
jgi:hypothetical protein